MELKEFISESLIQIFEGVSKAQEIVEKKYKGYINPVFVYHDELRDPYSENAGYSDKENVNFDVAVQVKEKSDTTGGITVFSGVFGVGTKANIGNEDLITTRIQFSVPIKYPGVNTNAKTKGEF